MDTRPRPDRTSRPDARSFPTIAIEDDHASYPLLAAGMAATLETESDEFDAPILSGLAIP